VAISDAVLVADAALQGQARCRKLLLLGLAAEGDLVALRFTPQLLCCPGRYRCLELAVTRSSPCMHDAAGTALTSCSDMMLLLLGSHITNKALPT